MSLLDVVYVLAMAQAAFILPVLLYDFVNLARVKEVERRLLDPRYGDDKIFTIGLECGFSSKSTLNANFKKHTGLTPSQYRSQARP